MTYFQFHLFFNLPALIGLLWLNRRWEYIPSEGWALGGVLLAVMVFTSPWDNWAVKRGIWDFPKNRVWKRIGYLPIEEYFFFILQSINVVLATRWLLLGFPQLKTGLETPLGLVQGACCAGVLMLWAVIGFRYGWRPKHEKYWYAWHLLFWFLPVIALQWALAPELFIKLSPVFLWITLFWGSYYTVCDLIAVHAGIWYFDPKQITGWKVGGVLPWEEIAFFYLTSLLVVQSYVLLVAKELR